MRNVIVVEALSMESHQFLDLYKRIDVATNSRKAEPFLHYLTADFRLFYPHGRIVSYPEFAEAWRREKTTGSIFTSVLDFQVTRVCRLENDLFEVTLETRGLIRLDGQVFSIDSQCIDTWVETWRGWCIMTRIKTRDMFHPSADLFGLASLGLETSRGTDVDGVLSVAPLRAEPAPGR